jgi:hypothetical protein
MLRLYAGVSHTLAQICVAYKTLRGQLPLPKKTAMIQSNFRDWNLDRIDEAFGTEQVNSLPALDALLGFAYEADDYERKYLLQMQGVYALGGDEWNEVELENKFISPVITFAGIDNRRFAYFLERELRATIGDYDLSGKVDGMIATGFRSPKKPYFCLAEYKRGTDPNGDPKGQALIAMLVAQHLNADQRPLIGCYVIGKYWQFVALSGRHYAISNSFVCDDKDIFDIYRVLKSLRYHIEQLLDTPQ